MTTLIKYLFSHIIYIDAPKQKVHKTSHNIYRVQWCKHLLWFTKHHSHDKHAIGKKCNAIIANLNIIAKIPYLFNGSICKFENIRYSDIINCVLYNVFQYVFDVKKSTFLLWS